MLIHEWGLDWRMPTKEELEELYQETKWEWVELDGVEGRRLTGPNGDYESCHVCGTYERCRGQAVRVVRSSKVQDY